jgi:hypothetical protein
MKSPGRRSASVFGSIICISHFSGCGLTVYAGFSQACRQSTGRQKEKLQRCRKNDQTAASLPQNPVLNGHNANVSSRDLLSRL